MAPLEGPHESAPSLRRLVARRSLAWTLLVGVFLAIGIFYNHKEIVQIAVNRARDSFRKDVAYRQWATERGGVYVPLDAKTPANPYLKDIPDRDIVGSNGKTYTLVNPAYMTRMVHELGAATFGLKGHLTSLNPIRPENAPDPWERLALQRFDRGAREYWEEVTSEGRPALRYMGAFLVTEGCLRCHSQQGYRVGDVRGGISVQVPLTMGATPGLDAHEAASLVGLATLWAAGIGAIFFLSRREDRQTRERQAAVEALGASQRTYQSLVEALPMKLYRLDSEGRLTFANRATLDELGLPLEACLGRTTRDFFPADYADRYQADDARVFAGATLHQVEDHPAPDGRSVRRVEVIKVPLKDAEGSVIGLQGLYWDVTEKLEAESRIQEGNRRFKTFIESCPLPIAVHQDGRFVYCNPACLALLGATDASALVGHPVADRVPPEQRDRVRARITEATDEGAAGVSTEEVILRMDGTPVEAEIRGFPITLSGAPARLLFVEALTERRRMERERRELERHLQHAQKMESLGALAGGVAHDMNNVLGAILGLASAHADSQPPDSPLGRALDTITKACTRGGDLVRRLLGFARQDLAEVRVLDLNALIQEEARLLERTTLARIQVVLDLESALQPIQGDPGALSHVVMNLCVNAVDAMPGGGTLTLRTRNSGKDQVELVVADTGSGMPPEVVERALDPFFTTKPQGKGTGLGLSLAYTTVTSHHGTLAIQSEPGQGTRIVLRFPACRPASPPTPPAPEGGRLPAPGLKVLLVDDDELIRASMVALLDLLGHTTTLAASGEEALALVEQGLHPEVVILDLNMPGLGGEGTLPRLRALRPEVPILLATGRADQNAMNLVQAHPGVTLLPKPFSLDELQERLRPRTS